MAVYQPKEKEQTECDAGQLSFVPSDESMVRSRPQTDWDIDLKSTKCFRCKKTAKGNAIISRDVRCCWTCIGAIRKGAK